MSKETTTAASRIRSPTLSGISSESTAREFMLLVLNH
jgi:hypothetical protein